jgi:uncharacterized membrane protein YhaH (DUF805 family)
VTLFHRVMRAGARLIFWLAIILFVVQLIDVAMAIKVMQQMSLQEQQFGPSVSLINVIPKLVGAFASPVLLIALAMVIDRLDAVAGRQVPRK